MSVRLVRLFRKTESMAGMLLAGVIISWHAESY